MKINEVVSAQQLDELDLKRSLAAGSLALAANTIGTAILPAQTKGQFISPPSTTQKAENSDWQQTAKKISQKYNVDYNLAYTIVKLAHKYEKPVFPKANDLLSIIGIESSFNPNAISGLKSDPAVGLTQIRPRVWKMNPAELRNDIEKQISTTSEILSKYNDTLKNPQKAIHAYNIGLTSFLHGKSNPKYVDKFNKERKNYI